ncbi:Oidioi.mRNA.OKI2018_I69.PAR.g8548.t1.cds [Oikopleura dioica]|uniref:Oidioi.mRNA.OKI2018_I69.PAR.g8548.t1.cds n=1 Tax=Oikopleura dioica TaxID=34765 RepID=A0ABN7RGI9_OIKDI|nr:Oidioi.mRNA.OKI2018_I69.PAR.g8548.t1.cds [Oikopleura dioica]
MRLLPFFLALVSAGTVDVTKFVTKTNTWTCRACFNVRLQFGFSQAGIKSWNSKTAWIEIGLSNEVGFIKTEGIVKKVDGNMKTYKFTFIPHFNPGDKRIDFNTEFRELMAAFGQNLGTKVEHVYVHGVATNNKTPPPTGGPTTTTTTTTTPPPLSFCGMDITEAHPTEEKGSWACDSDKDEKRQVRCKFQCFDGFKPFAISTCLRRERGNEWSKVRRGKLDCTTCAQNTLEEMYTIKGGSFKCNLEYDAGTAILRRGGDGGRVRSCSPKCNKPNPDIDGKIVFRCRNNKGWRLSQGSVDGNVINCK